MTEMSVPAISVSGIDAMIDRLLIREGGYVNNPNDNGGPTNFGITLAALHEWRGSPVNAAAVQALTRQEAATIYKSRYLIGPGFGVIVDPDLQEMVFDFAVNSGPGAAAKALQTALAEMGLYSGSIDGGFGPISKAALARCTNIPELYYRIKCERYALLLRFIRNDVRQATFAAGWANRLDSLNDKPN